MVSFSTYLFDSTIDWVNKVGLGLFIYLTISSFVLNLGGRYVTIVQTYAGIGRIYTY